MKGAKRIGIASFAQHLAAILLDFVNTGENMNSIILCREDQELIGAMTPDPKDLFARTMSISPDIISAALSLHESNLKSYIPVAAVCLQDAIHTLQEAIFAIDEAAKHYFYYTERSNPPDPHAGAFYGRFFADDSALRAYTCGEHLASAILRIHNIDRPILGNSKKRVTSLQAKVGIFVTEQFPSHPLTPAVLNLCNSHDWKKTMKYRNQWVHDQPYRILEINDRYARKIRWQKSSNGRSHKLFAEVVDTPDLSIAELFRFIRGGLTDFIHTFEIVVEHYIELIKPFGVKVSARESSVTLVF